MSTVPKLGSVLSWLSNKALVGSCSFLCTLQWRRAVSDQTCGGCLPSFRVMDVGRGVPTPQRAQRYMLGRGVKRKLSTCEDPAQDLPYPQQRQLVLDLCLDKLQSCQRRAEPSLHRSVLLANTLRQIQQEMRREGETCLPPAMLGPSLPHVSTPRHFPDLPPVPLDCPPPLTGALSPSFPLTMAEDDEVQFGGGVNETLLPSLAGEDDTRPSDSLFGSFEINNSTSYLTDLALDDIFDDIDTSMYDSSDISVLAFPVQRCSKFDDDLKSLSSCTSNNSLQLCLSDINDLDHIMEILVRS